MILLQIPLLSLAYSLLVHDADTLLPPLSGLNFSNAAGSNFSIVLGGGREAANLEEQIDSLLTGGSST